MIGGWCADVVVVLVVAGAVAGAAERQEAERVFLKGGDISLLARIEDWGGL